MRVGLLLAAADALERASVRIGRLAAWASVPMMLVILSDVILRRYFVIGSTQLQELEWHLHGFLFLACLGFAYARGAHVRIELFRERWSERTKAWVEVAGTLFLLLPFAGAVLVFGWDYANLSFAYSESSPTATGLGARWIIKFVLVAGFALLALSSLANLIRALIWLLTGDGRARAALEAELSDQVKTT